MNRTVERPNVLLIVADQHRGDWMPHNAETFSSLGMEGLPLRMPHVETLMREGATFTRAASPAPVCCPARACLASGLRYRRCGVPDNDVVYPLTQNTFFRQLKEEGYHVAAVGKAHLKGADRPMRLDGWDDDYGILGFDEAFVVEGKIESFINGFGDPKGPYVKHLHDRGLADAYLGELADTFRSYQEFRGGNPEKFPWPAVLGEKKNEPSSGCGAIVTKLPEEDYIDNWIAQRGVQMLSRFPKDRPWFFQVCFTNPHGPWPVTRLMKRGWENVSFPSPNRSENRSTSSWGADRRTEEQEQEIRRHYAAMLENIDNSIGLLLQELQNRGELENTLIVYTADHGEMLGDFHRYNKGRPERGSVNIPLVIWGLGVMKGVCSTALVELQDLAATFLDYSGIRLTDASHKRADSQPDSLSLRRVLEGRDETLRRYQVAEWLNWSMICDTEHKLVVERREDQTREKLYDLAADPWENINIAAQHIGVVERLKQQLDRELE